MVGIKGVDINVLVALAAVLEERNLTRAGERINISQPAMSGVLVRLRRHFGDELLVRVGREYQLTPLARVLLPTAQEALAQVERTLQMSRSFDPAATQRTFTISISDYALSVIAEPLTRAVRQAAPGASLTFDSLPRDKELLGKYLLRRDVLVGAPNRGIPGTRQALFRDRFVCVAAAGHPDVVDGAITPDRFTDAGFAATVFGQGIDTPVDQALRAAGVRIRTAMTVPTLLALPFAVTGTDMLAFVPLRMVRRCMEQLDLQIVRAPVTPAPLVEAAHWDPASGSEAGVQWLLGVLREVSTQVRISDPGGGADPDGASALR